MLSIEDQRVKEMRDGKREIFRESRGVEAEDKESDKMDRDREMENVESEGGEDAGFWQRQMKQSNSMLLRPDYYIFFSK